MFPCRLRQQGEPGNTIVCHPISDENENETSFCTHHSPRSTMKLSLHYLTQIVAFLPCHCSSISTRPCNCRLLQRAATSSIRASSSLSAARDSPSFEKKHQQKRNSGGEKYLANHKANRTKRDGKMNQRLYKAVSREDRTSKLELKLKETAKISESEINEFMPPSERAELNGLLKARSRFEEQYDPLAFTEEHLKFKALHNDVFLKLSLYCQRKRNQLKKANEEKDKVNVFFLDGPDGGTASALIEKGNFNANQCFVANRHKSSCETLRKSGGGILPDENVVHATAAEALAVAAPILLPGMNIEGSSAGEDDVSVSLNGEEGAFANVDFAAYYFDGCGGFVPHIMGMISSALIREDSGSKGPIAVGYSLLGGYKDIVGKELSISQALTVIARHRGMRLVHVLDDPLRFGLSPDVQKIGGLEGGGTFTTWLLLEPKGWN